MKATTFVQAIASHNWDTIPTQVTTLHDRRDLLNKIAGKEGKVYAIGINGIPESNYLYLYPDADQQQADFYETLKRTARHFECNENIADAICTDAEGQLVIVINIMEG